MQEVARYKILARRNSALGNVHQYNRDMILKWFHTLISVVKHVFCFNSWKDIQGKYQNPELNPYINVSIIDREHDEMFALGIQKQHSSANLFSALE